MHLQIWYKYTNGNISVQLIADTELHTELFAQEKLFPKEL